MTTRNETRLHNLDFLKTNLHFSQNGNSAVFQKDSKYFISPAVSEGKHGKYWIDIREANLKKIVLQNCFLMPRIKPNLFILENINNLNNLLSKDSMEWRSNSGNVWGIYMKINIQLKTATLFSKKNPENQITTALIPKDTIKETLNEVFT